MDIPIFSTPLLIKKFSKHEEYTERIKLFERSSKLPPYWICDVYTSFPFLEENDEHYGEIALDLKRDMLDEVKEMMREYDIPDNVNIDHFWYNGYYDGQGQENHNHLCAKNIFNPLWSGVYFHRNCYQGSFTFYKSDHSLRTQQTIDWDQTKLAGYYHEYLNIPMNDGDIMLFPPHMMHSVKVDERNSVNQRLTFSFNVLLNPLGNEE